MSIEWKSDKAITKHICKHIYGYNFDNKKYFDPKPNDVVIFKKFFDIKDQENPRQMSRNTTQLFEKYKNLPIEIIEKRGLNQGSVTLEQLNKAWDGCGKWYFYKDRYKCECINFCVTHPQNIKKYDNKTVPKNLLIGLHEVNNKLVICTCFVKDNYKDNCSAEEVFKLFQKKEYMKSFCYSFGGYSNNRGNWCLSMMAPNYETSEYCRFVLKNRNFGGLISSKFLLNHTDLVYSDEIDLESIVSESIYLTNDAIVLKAMSFEEKADFSVFLFYYFRELFWKTKDKNNKLLYRILAEKFNCDRHKFNKSIFEYLNLDIKYAIDKVLGKITEYYSKVCTNDSLDDYDVIDDVCYTVFVLSAIDYLYREKYLFEYEQFEKIEKTKKMFIDICHSANNDDLSDFIKFFFYN